MLNSPAILAVVFGVGLAIAVFASLRRALGLLLFFSFTPFFRFSLTFGASEVGIRPEDVVSLILMVRVLLQTTPRRLERDPRRFLVLFGGLIAILVIGQVISLVNAPLQLVSFYLIQKALGATALLFMAHRVIRTRDDAISCLWAIIAAGGVLALAVLVSDAPPSSERGMSAAFDREMYDLKDKQLQYLSSWNANVIGVCFGALVLIALSVAGDVRRRPSRIAASMFALFFLYMLLHSYTRAAIFAFFVTLSLMAARAVRKLSPGKVTVTILLVATALVVSSGMRREAFEFDLANDTNTGSRMAIWSAAVGAIIQHPLGYGVGLGDIAFEDAFTARLSAHNDWMDFALNIGVVGAGWALLTFGALGVALYRAAPSTRSVTLGSGGFAVFLFFVGCSLSHQVFQFSKQPFAILSVFLAFSNIRASNDWTLIRRVRAPWRVSTRRVQPPPTEPGTISRRDGLSVV